MKITRTVLVAALAASALAVGGTPAMATKGNCNPAPDPFNSQTLSKGNGDVTVNVDYGWDGVSVFPFCAGPIVGAHVTNTGQNTWYALFPKPHGGVRVITITPGFNKTYSATQLSAVGLDTLADISDFNLSTSPDSQQG